MRALLAVLVLAAFTSCAQHKPSLDDRARRLESQVWSPYCSGRLLSDCTTQQATELRATIADRLRTGDSETEVMHWLRANYGDEILARAQPGAAGAAAWLVPIGAILAGAVIVLGLVRRRSHGAPAPDTEPVPDGPADDLEPWIAKVREAIERDP
jgi:cytochrome c-type biogenesis protein CcmH